MRSADHLFTAIVHVPFGAMGVRTEAGTLRELSYLPANTAEKAPSDAVSEAAVRQVLAYVADADYRFDLPLQKVGSEFQRRVWDAICAIPRGKVLTYGEVARRIGSVPRAVGQACGDNWFPLVVPCHRVTSASGLGGFSHSADAEGFQLGVKRWLLKHESVPGFGDGTRNGTPDLFGDSAQ